MNYNKKAVLELLDSRTISAILKIYDISYSVLAFKFHCSKQNIVYLMRKDAFKDYQRQLIYETFKTHGMEDLELFLIHHMIHKKG